MWTEYQVRTTAEVTSSPPKTGESNFEYLILTRDEDLIVKIEHQGGIFLAKG